MEKNKGKVEVGIFEIILVVVLLIVLVIVLFSRVGFFVGIKDFFSGNFDYISGMVNLILSILAIFFLTIIAYSSVRLLEIRKREHEHLHHEIEEYSRHQREKEMERGDVVSTNENWLAVLRHVVSENQTDWKLAVIEADTILETLLTSLGFPGESLGDKLKSANQENFPDLSVAWEVHNLRNHIAHNVDYQLSQREAKRIIALYESIFRRYGFI